MLFDLYCFFFCVIFFYLRLFGAAVLTLGAAVTFKINLCASRHPLAFFRFGSPSRIKLYSYRLAIVLLTSSFLRVGLIFFALLVTYQPSVFGVPFFGGDPGGKDQNLVFCALRKMMPNFPLFPTPKFQI